MNYYGFDIETSCLDPFAKDAEILTHVLYHPVHMARTGADAIKDRVEDRATVLVGHNIVSFDAVWWRVHRGPVNAALFDTRVAYSLLDETGEDNSLAALTKKLLGYELNSEMKAQRKRMKDLPYDQVLKYNVEDAIASYKVGHILHHRLLQAGQMELFDWLMRTVAPPLIDMMVRGVLVDVSRIRQEGKVAESDITRLSYEMNIMAGRRPDIPEAFRHEDLKPLLNVDSPQQLVEFLYDDLGLPILEYTKGGQASTRAAVIEQLQRTVGNKYKIVGEFLQRLLDYREAKKLVSTYLVPLATKHLGTDGRVHTTYFLGKGYDGGTVTGRLSSSSPNLQNIPRDSRVKGVFIPSCGYRMFEADYAQLELRVAAWYSGEDVMLDAFAKGQDIHTATLARIEGREYEDVVKELEAGTNPALTEKRALVKRVNFGVLYGTGARKLQELMRDMGQDVSLRETQRTIDGWFKAYPRLSEWIGKTQELAIYHRQVVTPTGRVRHLPDAASPHTGQRGRALRQAVNFLVQSLASDVTLQALANLNGIFRAGEWHKEPRLLLTVHDSVVGEYHEYTDEAVLRRVLEQQMTENVNRALQHRFEIKPLPLAVDIRLGLERWGK